MLFIGNQLALSPKEWHKYRAACAHMGLPSSQPNWAAVYEAIGYPRDDSDVVEPYHVPLSDVLAWYLIGKQHEGRGSHET